MSDSAIGVAKRWHDKIEADYDCIPQIVRKEDAIGFNVGGREVGRVEERDGHVYATYYSPNDQPELPVFS